MNNLLYGLILLAFARLFSRLIYTDYKCDSIILMNKKLVWGFVIVVAVVIIVVGIKNSQKSPGTLSIGVISALTGNVAYIGESTMKGAEIGKLKAEEEHPGLAINMYHEDSMFVPQTGINAYNKLRQSYSINSLITMASNVSVAVEPLALKDNVLDIAASTLAAKYTTPEDLSFRMTSKADQEVTPVQSYLLAQHLTKLGVMYMNNEIGVSLNDALNKITEGSSVKIVSSEGYPADATDFRTILLKMKSAGVDSLYLASLAPHSAIILKQADELGLKVPMVSYRAAEDPVFIKNAGALAERLVYTNAYDSNSNSPENIEFSKRYMEKYNEEPNGYAAEAYEATRLIADTYSKCGDTTLDMKAVECSKSFLFGIKGRSTLFGPLSFDRNGDVSYQFFMKTVRGGKFVKL